MHGHEVDPFAHASIQNLGRMIGRLAYLCEFRQGTCLFSNDSIIGLLEETGEQLLHIWTWLRVGINTAWCNSFSILPAGRTRFLVRRIRTQRMLTRYYQDRTEGLYDVAIVGHTHKAGTFGDWYFNSGSWTGANNNFLRIDLDGEVSVFNWTDSGPQPNRTVVA
jgi:hypothetical protein